MEPLKRVVRRVFSWAGVDVTRRRPGRVPLDADLYAGETIEVVRPYTMTSPQRVLALCEAIRYIVRNGIPGDVVECGVWRGGSMMAAARTLLHLGETSRRLYLYDTFEGMPAPSARDRDLGGAAAADILAAQPRDTENRYWCVADQRDVERALLSTRYPAEGIRLVKGRVEDTIPGTMPDRIALLRLDTDWYSSSRHELEHLFPLLQPGGVLIVDDYGQWQGARQALDEYVATSRVPLLLHRIDSSARIAVKVSA